MPTRTRTLNRLKARTLDTRYRTRPPQRRRKSLPLRLARRCTQSWTFLYRSPGKAGSPSSGSVRCARSPWRRPASWRPGAPAHRQRREPEARSRLPSGEGELQRLRRTPHHVACGRPGAMPSSRSAMGGNFLKDAARLAPIPVDKITTEDVLAVLSTDLADEMHHGIAATRPHRARLGCRQGARVSSPEVENPARWRGHLEQTPARGASGTRGPHHPALPYAEVPIFMGAAEGGGHGARALEFTILTAARSGEAFGARWAEFDLERPRRTVPAERMKARREHRVPLSRAALAILERPARGRGRASLYFPAGAASQPLTAGEVVGARRLNAGSPCTASALPSATGRPRRRLPARSRRAGFGTHRRQRRRARRSARDLFDKRRRELMEAWAEFCTAERGKVLAFAALEPCRSKQDKIIMASLAKTGMLLTVTPVCDGSRDRDLRDRREPSLEVEAAPERFRLRRLLRQALAKLRDRVGAPGLAAESGCRDGRGPKPLSLSRLKEADLCHGLCRAPPLHQKA